MTVTEHRTHDSHEHRHGEGCGHAAVPHRDHRGDHVDYLHDGHAHAEHDGHYDECDPPAHAQAEAHADHVHGADCGHDALDHDGHTDYLHAGHRHAAHDDHYDEH